MFNIASEKMRFKGANMPGADPGFFLGGGGCTRLLLYFNTNKPHSFFFGRIPVENLRSSQGGGGGVRIYIYIYIYIYINKSRQFTVGSRTVLYN